MPLVISALNPFTAQLRWKIIWLIRSVGEEIDNDGQAALDLSEIGPVGVKSKLFTEACWLSKSQGSTYGSGLKDLLFYKWKDGGN